MFTHLAPVRDPLQPQACLVCPTWEGFLEGAGLWAPAPLRSSCGWGPCEQELGLSRASAQEAELVLCPAGWSPRCRPSLLAVALQFCA